MKYPPSWGFSLFVLFALNSLGSRVWAHEYRMDPVDIEIKLEPHQIRSQISSSAEYWLSEIFGLSPTQKLPATGWLDAYQVRAKEYISKSFQLQMDGRPLSPGSVACRFIEEPLNPKSARVMFEVVYPISSLGTRLSGQAQFFREYYEEIIRGGEFHPEDGVFVTRLYVKGGKELRTDLPYENPKFDFPTGGYEYTETQSKMERWWDWGLRMASSPFFWIFLVALIYQIYNRFLRRREI